VGVGRVAADAVGRAPAYPARGALSDAMQDPISELAALEWSERLSSLW